MASTFPIKFFPTLLLSRVPGYKGDCVAVWLNKNVLCNMIDSGRTGFFKRVKRIIPGIYVTFGEEFHGQLVRDGLNMWTVKKCD